MRPSRDAGFTLLELLLALAILSVILAVIMGALRLTVRAWEKGEDAVAAQQRLRTVLEQVQRQLGSTVVLTRGPEEPPLVPFGGTEHSVEFTSSLPLLTQTHAPPVHVRYLLETGPEERVRLLLYEEPVDAEDYLAEGMLVHDRDPLVLVEGLADLRFEYAQVAAEGTELSWASVWQPQTMVEVPRAVRITARAQPDRDPVRVIARVHLWQRFRAEP